MLTGLVDTDHPAQYQETYFAPCHCVSAILAAINYITVHVPELDALPRDSAENNVPPIPVRQPGRPPKAKQAPGPKPKEKRIPSRGEVAFPKKRRKTKAGQSGSKAAAEAE